MERGGKDGASENTTDTVYFVAGVEASVPASLSSLLSLNSLLHTSSFVTILV